MEDQFKREARTIAELKKEIGLALEQSFGLERRVITELMKELGKALEPHFGRETVNQDQAWEALPLEAPLSGRSAELLPAYFHFRYQFPAPKAHAEHDMILDFLQPAIWAYCACQQFMRSPEGRLFDAALDRHSEWKNHEKARKLAKSLNGSMSGRKQPRKIDPDKAEKLRKEGKNNVEIANEFGITPQAVGQHFKKRK